MQPSAVTACMQLHCRVAWYGSADIMGADAWRRSLAQHARYPCVLTKGNDAGQTCTLVLCAGEGLDVASYNMLQAKLGADARGSTLLPFVQPSASDHRLAAPENRHTLQCLASSGPVSQFLRPQAAPIVRRLLQVASTPPQPLRSVLASTQSSCGSICSTHQDGVSRHHSFGTAQGEVLSLGDWHALHRLCPILHMFLKHHLDAEDVPPSLGELLTTTLQVQAIVPGCCVAAVCASCSRPCQVVHGSYAQIRMAAMLAGCPCPCRRQSVRTYTSQQNAC